MGFFMIKHRYKYEMVADEIRQAINDNTFNRKVLPGEKELMARYNIGRRTLSHALTNLTREGTIKRVQRKGSVIMARENAMTLSDQIAVIMTRPNEANEIMYQTIIQGIVDHNHFCITTLFDHEEKDEARRQQKISKLHQLLNSPIAGIIALGEGYYRYPFMSGHEDVPSVFLKCFESKDPLPGKGVFCDFAAAARIATEHLISGGHQNIALYFFQPQSVKAGTEIIVSEHPTSLFIASYWKTMKEHGLSECSRVVFRSDQDDGNTHELTMRGMLTGEDRPTAIICCSDNEAAQFVELAQQLKIKVPEELAIIGMYDTPWCQRSPVKLTSISMEEKTVGQEAVKLLLSPNNKHEIVKVPPKLIIRESCGIRR